MFQVKDQHFSHSKVRIQRDIWSPLVNTLGGEKKYEFSLLRFEISAPLLSARPQEIWKIRAVVHVISLQLLKQHI